MFRGLNLSSFSYSSRCLGQWDQPGERHRSFPPAALSCQPIQTLQVQGDRRQTEYAQSLPGTWGRSHVSLATKQGKTQQSSLG